MPNLAAALREEITRLARKEIKKETGALRKANAQYRRNIAELKRRVAGLEKKVAFLEKQTVSDARGGVGGSMGGATKDAEGIRFSAAWVKKHREKIGFSQKDYGVLVGVSALTIYNWESERTRPRNEQLVALAAVRKLGKREAEARWEVLCEG